MRQSRPRRQLSCLAQVPCSTVLKPGLVERYSSALCPAGPRKTPTNIDPKTHLWRRLWFLLAHCGSCGWALFSDWQYQIGTTGNDYVYGLAIDSDGPEVVGSTASDLYGTSQGEELSCLLSSRGFPGFPRIPRIHVGKEFSCWKSQNFQISPSVQVGQTGFLRGSATLAANDDVARSLAVSCVRTSCVRTSCVWTSCV